MHIIIENKLKIASSTNLFLNKESLNSNQKRETLPNTPPISIFSSLLWLHLQLNRCMSEVEALLAQFRPTKHDLVRRMTTCLTSQRFEAKFHRLIGAVWHTGPTPLIYLSWNLQALLRKQEDLCHMTSYQHRLQRAVVKQHEYCGQKKRLLDGSWC